MTSELANHLWQSTLFACVIGLLAVTMRRNRGAVRHALWLAASLKFLVPFSLLMSLGSEMEWKRPPAVLHPRFEVVEQVSEPFLRLASPAPAIASRTVSRLPAILFGLWLCGFAACSLAWWRRWRQVRSTLRTASPLHSNLPIPVISSSQNLEPGVFGIFRPVLLLPDGIRERLTPGQFEAIVAHELCHVRRRDNLWLAIHMVVESLFWFHPLVWWIEARLVEERERACDEDVLRMGGDPEEYAQGILAVCKFYLKSPLACAAGVTGSSLKQRVEEIMINRLVDKMSIGKKLLLAAVGLSALTGPLLVGMMRPPSLSAQEPVTDGKQLIVTSTLPEFEVASIKPSAPDANLKVVFAPGEKLFITNATLRFLIKIAYDIGDDQLAGGPGWISSKRFDLVATPGSPLGGDPQNMTPEQLNEFHQPVRLRLQRLLADRFQLQMRREPTPMPIFALVIAKGGPKKLALSQSTGKPQLNGKFGSGMLTAAGVDMATLAHFLSEGQTGRPVVDMTGLDGRYDFQLDWAPEPGGAGPASVDGAASPSSSDRGGVSIFTALQQQLGLKLEPRTGTAERLVVVGSQLPSMN